MLKELKKIKSEEDSALVASFVNTHKLKTLQETKARLIEETSKVREFLASNRYYPTINRARRQKTKELEYLERLKQIIGKI